MSGRIRLLGLLAIVIVLAAFWWRGGEKEPHPADSTNPTGKVAHAKPRTSSRPRAGSPAEESGEATEGLAREIAVPAMAVDASSPEEPPDNSATLLLVLLTADGAPVPGARVLVDPAREDEDGDLLPSSPGSEPVPPATTDESGEVTFSDLAPGTYVIRPGHPDLWGARRQRDPEPATGWYLRKHARRGWPRPGELRIRVAAGSSRREIVVDLTSVVTGRVVDVEGLPVRATVETRFEAPGYSQGGEQQTICRDDGRFTLSEIPVPEAGELFLLIEPPGFDHGAGLPLVRRILLELAPGRIVDLGTIRLDHVSGAIVGRLVDPEGLPVFGARLDLSSTDHERPLAGFHRSASTEEGGGFTFTGVLPGAYELVCEDHTLVPGGRLSVESPASARELDLGDIVCERRGWILEGSLLLADGAPAEGAEIHIDGHGLVADAAGRFTHPVDGRRSLEISWWPPGWGPGEVMWDRIDPPPPDVNVLEVELRTRGLVLELRDAETGELVDSDRAVVRRASLDESSVSTVRHDSPGPRIRVRSPVGEFDITLRVDGYAAVTLREAITEEMTVNAEKTVVVRLERKE